MMKIASAAAVARERGSESERESKRECVSEKARDRKCVNEAEDFCAPGVIHLEIFWCIKMQSYCTY